MFTITIYTVLVMDLFLEHGNIPRVMTCNLLHCVYTLTPLPDIGSICHTYDVNVFYEFVVIDGYRNINLCCKLAFVGFLYEY